jgi:hypothetical protein
MAHVRSTSAAHGRARNRPGERLIGPTDHFQIQMPVHNASNLPAAGAAAGLGRALGWADFQVRSDTAIRRHQAQVNCAFSFRLIWLHRLGAGDGAWPPSASANHSFDRLAN